MSSNDMGDLKNWYRYHGLLMAVGLGIFLPLSFIFARFGVIRPDKLIKNYFFAMHALFCISTFFCIGGGLYFSIEHFPGNFLDRAQRFHSLTGLITIGLLLSITATSVVQPAFKSKRRSIWVWIHKLFGIFVLIFSIFVSVTGIIKYHDQTKDKKYMLFVAVYCAVVFSLTLFYFVLLCVSPYKEIKDEIDPLEAKATALGEFDDESWPPEEIIFGTKKVTASESQPDGQVSENTDGPNPEAPKPTWSNHRPNSGQRLRPTEN